MPYIEVDPGVRVFVQDWGAGPPAVFVHGFPFSGRIFEPQMAALAAAGKRAVAVDLRGFGRSDQPWDGLDYDTWAADLGKVMAALDLRGVTLVGFSMGGAIAGLYASRGDSRVAKLALLGAAAPIAAPAPADKQKLDGLAAAAKADRAAFVVEFVKGAFHATPSPEYARYLADVCDQASARALARGLAELRDRDVVAAFASLRLPTLICHRVHDAVVPLAAGEAQHGMIPGSTLVRFEHSGHGLFHEEADKLSAELVRFVG